MKWQKGHFNNNLIRISRKNFSSKGQQRPVAPFLVVVVISPKNSNKNFLAYYISMRLPSQRLRNNREFSLSRVSDGWSSVN